MNGYFCLILFRKIYKKLSIQKIIFILFMGIRTPQISPERHFITQKYSAIKQNQSQHKTPPQAHPSLLFIQNKRNIGLTNERNTCFINSSMQCLCNIPQLAQSYLKAVQKTDRLNRQIISLMKAMWDDNDDRKYPYDMSHFYNEILNNIELYKYNRYRQMDSPQFIQNILNFMQSHPLEAEQGKQNKVKNIVKEIFGGRFHTQIICKEQSHHKQDPCNYHIVDIKQAFLSIPLTVYEHDHIQEQKFTPVYNYIYGYYNMKEISPRQKPKKAISLIDCLKNFTKKQMLSQDDKWYCKKCEKDTLSEKQMMICEVGSVLILQLLRFIGERKMQDVIEYPLQLSQHDFKEDQKEDPLLIVKYRLIGVICHIGSTIKSGHYYSVTYNEQQGKWYRQSDSYISKAQKYDFTNNRDAYVLFYQKVNV